MNKRIELIKTQLQGKIIVTDRKNAVLCIINNLIANRIFLVSNDTFFFRFKNLLIPMSDKEVYMVIRIIIDPESRAKISSSAVKEIAERLRNMPEVQTDIEKLWNRSYKVLLKNGSFHVKNQTFDPNPPKDEWYPYQLNFNYRKNASFDQAPNFKQFVASSLGNENLDCFLEWLGYSCTAITEARKSMTFIGPEKCGKSLIIDIMEDAIGIENTVSVPFHQIGTEQSRIKYQGKIANFSREISAEPLKNEEAFKSLVAGERITGRRLYENSKEFVPYVKFTNASNFFPLFKHPDTAVLDRMLLIYFKDRVAEHIETDYHLKEKLLAEKDIIFSMALDKTVGLIQSDYAFHMSDRAKNVLANKRMELLNVSAFLKENFELDTATTISSAHLYGLYKDWCNVNAIAPDGRNTFYSKVTDYSSKISRGKFIFGTRNLNGFKGLKYKGNYNDDLYGQSYQDSPVSTQKGGDSK